MPTFTPPSSVEHTFLVQPGLYLIGSLERGVTVYNQQVRAHNLVWSLLERSKADMGPIERVAIIGGGITGLTAAACLLSTFPSVSVTIFERQWDLCPLQQGSDTRWLHPRIYEWPGYESRAPNASLPVLNWSEGRASDVARELIRKFSLYTAEYAPETDRLRIYLGLSHLRIHAANRQIEWMGRRTADQGPFFRVGVPEGSTEEFDTIILASGFGLERQSLHAVATPSYWRNDQLGQPLLNGSRQVYVVSGYGDGAIVDLCRLTIERFRQDTILYEIFGSNLEDIEAEFRGHNPNRISNVLDLLQITMGKDLTDAVSYLGKRLRKDTQVILHASGTTTKNTALPDLFGQTSSFLNRFLLYALYRCGAFSVSFGSLEDVIRQYQPLLSNVFRRHGTDALGNVLDLFANASSMKPALQALQNHRNQAPERLWVPGTFPHLT